MKKFSLLLLLVSFIGFAQQPYYNGVDFTLTGEDLYNELQQKISVYNTAFTYGDARDVLLFTDEDPDNSNNVLLVYGYNDNDGNCVTDRSRNKNNFGGNNCQYNREHVFARSQADPTMGNPSNISTGIVADPHNIRSSDVQMNNNRGDKKFQNGSGNAGNAGSGNWYPGDEWKGDVARIVMYMYTRYDEQCLPSYAGSGSLQGTTQMLQTFLQWNADDPVSEVEDQRNAYLETAYGNRNPFIDNPVLATIIWGGPQAEDRWGILSNQDIFTNDYIVYPNPSIKNEITITSTATIDAVIFYDVNGRIVLQLYQPVNTNNAVIVKEIPSGFYFMEISSGTESVVKKVLVK